MNFGPWKQKAKGLGGYPLIVSFASCLSNSNWHKMATRMFYKTQWPASHFSISGEAGKLYWPAQELTVSGLMTAATATHLLLISLWTAVTIEKNMPPITAYWLISKPIIMNVDLPAAYQVLPLAVYRKRNVNPLRNRGKIQNNYKTLISPCSLEPQRW